MLTGIPRHSQEWINITSLSRQRPQPEEVVVESRSFFSSVRMFFPIVVLLLVHASAVFAGPYTEAGIPKDDQSIAGWATGYLNYVRSDGGTAYGDPALALGPAAGGLFDVVSLGEVDPPDDGVAPGEITLTFDEIIIDGAGWDIVVFENAFGSTYPDAVFAELAYVEISTDGTTFARFPSVSNIPYTPGGFFNLDVSECYNLAGKQLQGFGGPFDLSELSDQPEVLSGEVDLNEINYIKIVDIPGYGTQAGTTAGYIDSLGNPIHDNWPTTDSGGFDLDAVGYRHCDGCSTAADDDDAAGNDDSTGDDDDATDDDDDSGDDSPSSDFGGTGNDGNNDGCGS